MQFNLNNEMLKKFICILILFFTFSKIVNAGALEDALNEFKNLLYITAAGVAALILVIHGIRLKLAGSPSEREEAKKGIIFVILGLVLIILAVMIVGLIYKTPPQQPPTGTTTTFRVTTHYTWTNTSATTIPIGPTTTNPGMTTTKRSTTTSTTSTSTTTTSTTTTSTTLPYLTAKNLVDCINSEGGILYAEFTSCPACAAQRRIFTAETTPPVGPGSPEFNRLTIRSPYGCPCNAIPCWSYGSTHRAGCKTMPQLNSLFGCNLIPYPGHIYLSCA